MGATNPDVVDAVIVGGGQAGLGTAYYLTSAGLDVVVLERGRVGETWRSQRWDSFCLNTPNWMNGLPGAPYDGADPFGFMTHGELIESFEEYVDQFNLPVRTGVAVTCVEASSGEHRFAVTGEMPDGGSVSYVTDSVIIAAGILQSPKIPAICAELPPSIAQIHAGEYRNAQQLRDGAVVVVGGGQSGAQIVEDLLTAARRVYFSISGAVRVPRSYRGKDVMDWLVGVGFWDVKTTEAPPEMLAQTNPLLSGVGPLGHSVSYQQLARMGVGLLGRLESIADGVMTTDDRVLEYIGAADEFSRQTRNKIDRYIEESGSDAAAPEPDPGDEPMGSDEVILFETSLNLEEAGVSTVIWSTGFTADFSWIDLPVTDGNGVLDHRDGVSVVDGVYFIGFPWISKRRSGVIFGIDEDAQHVANAVLADIAAR